VLLFQAALGLAQPAAPTLRGRQLGWQLIAAPLTELLVLLGIDRVGLGQDLARDVLVAASRAATRSRSASCRRSRPTPTCTNPASAHSVSTSPNRPAIAASWRCRKRAIVV
jgi:hypothetical protein